MKPKLSKISPIGGAKRLFGKQAWANLLKGIFKVVAIGAVMTMVFWPERHRLDAMVRMDLMSIVTASKTLSLQLLGTVVAMLAVVAIADYLFQYRTWFERQKMSLQEIKEEFKQTEGDPHIKGRLRQLRDARRKKRMMAAVPTASVVITNPTHFAVALKYEQGMAAPICVAKGLDAIALKIREVAKEQRRAGDREPAAGAGAARRRQDRRRNPGRALPGGRRGDRLRHEAEARVCGPAALMRKQQSSNRR